LVAVIISSTLSDSIAKRRIFSSLTKKGLNLTSFPVDGIVNATENHTMIRDPDICIGNFGNWSLSDGSIFSSEWIVGSSDDFSNIYSHSSNCPPPSSIEEALAMCDSLPAEDQDVCRTEISKAAARDAGGAEEGRGGSKKPLIIGLLMLLFGGLGIIVLLKRKKPKAPQAPYKGFEPKKTKTFKTKRPNRQMSWVTA
jgi:hypothetical protein